ncbi:unnamed protein product [Hermetia illucens]|uniref:Uncharacterized protein n=2 Tax=Hermetia illucens TaxID=343691 RepID=A0A7R8YSN6_HERIL|nr:unnamed protein product [Hermetia illucens]
MLLTAFALIMFGDYFGYANIRTTASKNPTTLRDAQPELDIEEVVQEPNKLKARLAGAIRESCLPKMLCEMASRPEYTLSDREKELLQLLKSTTMSLTMNGPPTKWHFAAHMGELMKYTGDANSGPIGCASLWSQCPFSSKKLMKLTYKVNLK